LKPEVEENPPCLEIEQTRNNTRLNNFIDRRFAFYTTNIKNLTNIKNQSNTIITIIMITITH